MSVSYPEAASYQKLTIPVLIGGPANGQHIPSPELIHAKISYVTPLGTASELYSQRTGYIDVGGFTRVISYFAHTSLSDEAGEKALYDWIFDTVINGTHTPKPSLEDAVWE